LLVALDRVVGLDQHVERHVQSHVIVKMSIMVSLFCWKGRSQTMVSVLGATGPAELYMGK
jgi:hypothetical protein